MAWRLTGHAGGDPCEELVVIINSRKEPVSIDIPDWKAASDSNSSMPENGPEHRYTVYCRDGRISTDGLGTITGPVLSVGPQQALIVGR